MLLSLVSVIQRIGIGLTYLWLHKINTKQNVWPGTALIFDGQTEFLNQAHNCVTNRVTNDTYVTLSLAFDPPTHYNTNVLFKKVSSSLDVKTQCMHKL